MDMDTTTTTPEPGKKTPQRPLPELSPPNKISPANQTCWYLGAALVATGLVGFVVPGLFYLHLNPVHNMILIVSGAIAFWFGLTSPNYTAKRFCQWFGGAYLVFGLAGFAFGTRALSLTRPTATGIAAESSFLWKLVPGSFELGTMDHSLHILAGLIFLAGAFFTLRKKHQPSDAKIMWQ